MAATPSPRPVSPRPSVVVADNETDAPDSAALSTATASARREPILGRLPMT
jgi:O-acetylserine/cysteine efflux transporter